ncbi:hypothetical protein ACKGLS_003459 [Vibrio alginolyticus]|uniref:phosphoribosyltransferase-like protein n=1 Tax=Vibrio harveyi group TaxID=717610 RepID=UPI000D73DF81|nr:MULTISPECIES: hypothetical protein [Vibrio harveyi group]HBC3532284.1 hypothetical protein [Vibrio vulnificus]MBS9955481.1 hypothetical protein [Vibrio alginolyticus]MCG9741274.1 hypothetical protein [Vibrio alginolyticus]MDF5024899.1 hypothetical protein [Vibrio parahaemolyticus]MDF5059059.1 hypothetical protein [Vibrio parahaemolyticus]
MNDRVDSLNPEPNAKKLIHTKQGKAWLEQFELVDREVATFVANKLTLVSHTEFERNLLKTLENIASSYGGRIGFFAVRELEKKQPPKSTLDDGIIPFYSQVNSDDGISVNALSSSSDQGSEARIAQVIRQLCKAHPNKYLNHPTLESLRDNKCDAIIFVDDFIGSGNRVREFLTSFWIEPSVVSWLSGKQMKFHVVAYSGMEEGIASVERHRSKPSVSIYRDAPTYDSFLWDKSKKEKVKNVFSKYGRIANQKRKNMWFGYKEGMGAIVFEHGCPNNTPAILWEPDFQGSGWKGLFPNRTISSEVASVFPPEIVSGDPIEILMEVGQVKLAKSGLLSRRGEIGKIFLTALALIAKGQRKRSTLSYATGLSVDDCERLMEKCIRCGFITVNRRLTPRGVAELNAVRRWRVRNFKPLDKGTNYYYPVQLRETTND